MPVLQQRPERPLVTKREQQVLDLLGEGLVNKQIAGRLHISACTVKYHLRRLAAKLALAHGTRTELLATAFRRGLVR